MKNFNDNIYKRNYYEKIQSRGVCQSKTPEVALAVDHYLMFRWPDGCNKNASIEFAGLESDLGKEKNLVV